MMRTTPEEASYVIAAHFPNEAMTVVDSFHESRKPRLLGVTQRRAERCRVREGSWFVEHAKSVRDRDRKLQEGGTAECARLKVRCSVAVEQGEVQIKPVPSDGPSIFLTSEELLQNVFGSPKFHISQIGTC